MSARGCFKWMTGQTEQRVAEDGGAGRDGPSVDTRGKRGIKHQVSQSISHQVNLQSVRPTHRVPNRLQQARAHELLPVGALQRQRPLQQPSEAGGHGPRTQPGV